jgi:8-oxo-dGTP diphosphatase
MREVWEETGHDVSVHEFLGTLAYDLRGRSKIVHYWRMDTQGRSTRELMKDVTAVDWLPLQAAVERLSRDHERAFLANVGPLALQSAALGKRSQETRQETGRETRQETRQEIKAVGPIKRRHRRTVASKPSPALAPSVAPLPDVAVPAIAPVQPALSGHEAIGTGPSDLWAMPETAQPAAETAAVDSVPVDSVPVDLAAGDPVPFAQGAAAEKQRSLRGDLLRRVRAWLRRAA